MAECPGIYKLAEMKDGLLARVRVPGGVLSSKQAKAISNAAKTFGNGWVDLTNRANIQLRGIKPEKKSELIEYLFEEKLISPFPAHDRLRNITIDPLSGLSQELYNCSHLVEKLDKALQDLDQPELFSPKCAFVFDGGGETNIRATPHDFAFLAFKNELETSRTEFQLYLGGMATTVRLSPETIIETIMDYLERLKPYAAENQEIAEDKTKNIRLKNLIREKGRDRVLEIIAPNSDAKFIDGAQPIKLQKPDNLTEQTTENKVAINLISPTSRLQYFQLEGLTELAETLGSGELRLTTWQGIILPSIDEDDIAHVWEKAEAMALLTQENEQNLQIISCSGSEGCIYGGFETKLLSLQIRDDLSELAMLNPVSIHLSACEKGCATTKKSNYLILQKRDKEEISLHVNQAPNTKEKGKIINESQIIRELKKLI